MSDDIYVSQSMKFTLDHIGMNIMMITRTSDYLIFGTTYRISLRNLFVIRFKLEFHVYFSNWSGLYMY